MLYSPTQQPLRRVVVRSPGVNVEVQPDGSLGKVTIDSAGQMLYEDLQPPATTQPTTTTVVPRLPETGQASGWLVGAGGAFLLAGLGMLRVRGGTRRV